MIAAVQHDRTVMEPMRVSLAKPALQQPVAGRAVFAALCAVFVGIGLARFAYAPLVPALITEGWFSGAEAGYLGAANFVGYLAGAAVAHIVALRIGVRPALRLMMLLASASFFACAFPLSFPWFFIWRFASGLAGGALMVIAASAVLPLVGPTRRGLANGVIFIGVGIGIALSGTVVPLLLRVGLQETWLMLGVAALIGTLAAWNGWPTPRPQDVVARLSDSVEAPREPKELVVLLIAYALVGAGLIPHMVFLVDYASRGLGHGLEAASFYWILFGLGALIGPVCAGRLGDQVGFRSALGVVLAIEVLAIGLPSISENPIALGVSSILVGAFVPGVVPLVLGRLHEMIPADDARRKAWGRATMAFATGQAVGGLLFSFIFAQRGGGYPLLFVFGAATLAIALVITMKPSVTSVIRSNEASS